MQRPARPLLVHLGDSAWVVYDRISRRVLLRTRSLVKALVEWLAIVTHQYHRQLENGAYLPRIGGVEFADAPVAPAEPMDVVDQKHG